MSVTSGKSDWTLRRMSKGALFVIGLVAVSPLILLAHIESLIGGGERAFGGIAQLLALVPSQIGSIFRSAYYFATLHRCSWETHIGFGSLFAHRGSIVARHVSMGVYCVIGHTCIERNVMIGSRVSIPSGKRQHFDDSGSIVSESRFDTVTIGEGSWIGEGAIVLADIGRRCVVSAGAVVTKMAPDDCVVGGNPAKVIRSLA